MPLTAVSCVCAAGNGEDLTYAHTVHGAGGVQGWIGDCSGEEEDLGCS